jgi:GH35 family endo-1,4-beta-xylanase
MKISILPIALLALLLAIQLPNTAAEAPSLKEAFAAHFPVGTAINRSQATGTSGRRSPEQVAQEVALVRQHFNQITAENDMKWQLIHPREGKDGYDFGPADAFVNFGLSNRMEVVGHTLVWHSQTPNWVFAGTNPPPVITNAPPVAAAGTNALGTNRGGRGPGPGFGGGFGRYNGPARPVTNCSSGCAITSTPSLAATRAR